MEHNPPPNVFTNVRVLHKTVVVKKKCITLFVTNYVFKILLMAVVGKNNKTGKLDLNSKRGRLSERNNYIVAYISRDIIYRIKLVRYSITSQRRSTIAQKTKITIVTRACVFFRTFRSIFRDCTICTPPTSLETLSDTTVSLFNF